MPDVNPFDWRIWRRWVVANAWSELIGLAGSAGIVLLLFGTAEPARPAEILLAAAATIILATLLEGVVVGFAQWRVLSDALRPLPGGPPTARQWIGATALGACVAWVLGMLPSTIMSFQQPTAQAGFPEPGLGLMVGLAAIMGLVLGPVLAFFQWLVLRRYLQGAAWWMPANAMAWAFGMMAIFLGAGALSADASLWTIAGVLASACLLAGAVVGAIHGLALLWLLSKNRAHQEPCSSS